MSLKHLFILLLIGCSSSSLFSQSMDWRGTRFVFTQPNTPFILMNIKICSEEDHTGSIQFNDTTIYFQAKANQCASVVLYPYFFDSALVTGKNFKQAINLVCSKKASCYVTKFNSSEDDGYNVLPINALDSVYTDVHFDPLINDTALYKNIIAIEDNTIVQLETNQQFYSSDTLQKNEVLVLERKPINIKSNKSIAYFTSSKNNIAGSNCTEDLCCKEELYEQILPSTFLGKNYLLNSIHDKNESAIVVNAFENNTCIEINGKAITLQKAESYLHYTKEACILRASKKIAVHRFFESNVCMNNSMGDPEIMQVLPIEFLDKESVFFPVNGYFEKYYLNIIVPNQSLDSIYLNDENIQAKFSKLNEFYSRAEFEIGYKQHKLSASNGFQAFTYGLTSNLAGPNSAAYQLHGSGHFLEYQIKKNKSYEEITLCNDQHTTYVSADTNSVFLWNDGIYSNNRTFTESGFYIVNVNNACLNFQYSDTLKIKKENCLCTPNVPEVFSPNDDGKNDELQIEYNCNTNPFFKLEIYNRWGKLIYSGSEKSWNGKDASNQDTENGTYVYVIHYSDQNNQEKMKSGIFSIIK